MTNFSETIGFTTLKITRRLFQIVLALGILTLIFNHYKHFIGTLYLVEIIALILLSVVIGGYLMIRHFGEYYQDRQ